MAVWAEEGTGTDVRWGAVCPLHRSSAAGTRPKGDNRPKADMAGTRAPKPSVARRSENPGTDAGVIGALTIGQQPWHLRGCR